jgi:predicted transposase/invertase (TIGR01784 family)
MMTSPSITPTSKQHSTPHDAFFKAMTANKAVTQDLLKAVLPPRLLQTVDLDSLELSPSSFVDNALDYFHCDVVYRCNIHDKEGYVIFLLEHQSTADPSMAYRLLEYQFRIWQTHFKQHTGPGPCKLPSILPLCIYHGPQSPYPYSTKLTDCFMDPEFIQEWTFKRFLLLDLTQMSTEDMESHGLAGLLELLLQRSRNQASLFDDLPIVLEFLRKVFRELRDSGGLFEVVLEYTLSLSGDPQKEDELIKRMVLELPEKKEAVMSYAKRMEEIGLQKGLQKGVQQTRDEIARIMAQDGVEPAYISRATGLPIEQVIQMARAR